MLLCLFFHREVTMVRCRDATICAVILIASGCGGSGGKKVVPVCSGSGLANDPTGRNCQMPTAPTQGCNGATAVAPPKVFPLPNTFEAETRVAFDPRSGANTIFAATIQVDVVPDTTGLVANCVAAKHIVLYRSADGGGNFTAMSGLPPQTPDEWATDPGITVGPDGTLYLVFLRWIGPCGATTGTCNRCGNPSDATSAIELWFAPPGDGKLHPGLPDDTTLQSALSGNPSTSFPNGPGQFPAIVGSEKKADHPEIAVNPAKAGNVVVYFLSSSATAPDGTPSDFVATFQQANSTAMLSPSASNLFLGSQSTFSNPAFDASGNLYLAMGLVAENGAFTFVPVVRKFSFNNGGWSQVGTDGLPPLLGAYAYATDASLAVPSSPAVSFLPDPTPMIAVGNVGSTSDPVVYTAFEIFDPSTGTREVELTAANGTDITKWVTPTVLPLPSGGLFSFHPALSLSGGNNILDVASAELDGPSNGALSSIGMKQFLYRFDAAHLTLFAGPLPLSVAPPALSDLPRRPPPAGTSGSSTVLYPGDYNAVATNGTTAWASWPELNRSGLANVDLAVTSVNTTCGSALTLVDPDSLWECTCQCGPNESDLFPVVGCASGSATTANAACQQVCKQNICGGSLTCGNGVCNGAFTGGRLLSTQSCAQSDGPPAGPAPASFADYVATATSASIATFHLGGQTATSSLGGQLFVNSSTSPPVAGAVAEISRLIVQPANFFLGGSINAQVQNITVVHPARIRGIFTDATHFTVPPGGASFVVTLQTGSGIGDPDNPDARGLSAPTNILAGNPTPLAGTLNLAAGTVSLDGSASDSSGNSVQLHFQGSITSRPPDSNGNGIIDAVDHCPAEKFGPDLTAPVFTFVPPPITISSCTNANIGTARATDPCGVTITNNAPAKFALGTTVVTWTAKDGVGNVVTATQDVTAVLGNDVSCCPAGSHVIVGTSNNDVIVGTSGPDCILGLGGQDTIHGGDGDDVISGGDGDDVIFGEGGNDKLYGGSGQDTISGGLGNDLIDGGDGVDTLNGDDGNDVIRGGQGGDIVHGGTGNDFIDGGPDDDQLHGDDGDDQIFGGAGNDHLFGENGNDSLGGGDGDDTLDGGAGTNTFDPGTGHDVCIDDNMTLPTCRADAD
jgi:Ca2+-binding RTX toxin-like protein